MESDLELNQNFFLCDNVVHKQKEIPEKTVKNDIVRRIECR